jgi:CheY-like chemotaxis protein
MDGFDLGQRIKADPLLSRTSLVMLTSGSQRSAADVFLLAGFSVFLCKPVVRPSQLFDALIKAWSAHPDHGPEVPATVRKSDPMLARSAGSRAGVPPAANTARCFKVLVAEDNTVNQRLVKRMLENLGASVELVADGREAVACVLRADYDVVLMDCFMPEMDGYEATLEIRRLQAERGGRRVPIIALTANALPADRDKCLAAGMDDYLSKPVRKEDIQAALARCGVISERALDHTAIHA